MSRFYNDTITALFLQPKHAGCIAKPNIKVQAGHPGLSDVIQLTLAIDNGIIQSAKFKADGRLTSIAAAEYICQHIEQQPIAILSTLTQQQIIDALQLPSIRISSAVLAEQVLQKAVMFLNAYDAKR